MAPSHRPKAAYLMDPNRFDRVYGPDEQADLGALVDFIRPRPLTPDELQDASLLADVSVILASWGMPQCTPELLDLMPKLQAVFYGAGAISGWVTPEFWDRGIRVTTASSANAIPVAEFTFAAIVMSLKRAFHQHATVRQQQNFRRLPLHGAYKTTVGLVSMGLIGKLTRNLLRNLDVRVVAYDPYLSEADGRALNVELVSLEDLFACAHVVSVHAPWTKATQGMITGKLLSSMMPGAAFINTARGAIVREAELFSVLADRPDLQAIVDVTYPEPPVAGSPFYTLPNVFLTPHIAGSIDNECRRMGRYMVDELARFLSGKPLHYELTVQSLVGSAHEGV